MDFIGDNITEYDVVMSLQFEDPTQNVSGCDELRDLLPAYSVGATTPEESARVEALLMECPEIAAELPDYAALMAEMTLLVEPVQPPAALHDKLMAAVRATENAARQDVKPRLTAESPTPTLWTVAPTPTKPEPHARRVLSVRLVAAAAAVAALLILSNAYWLSQVSSLRGERDQLAATLSGQSALIAAIDSGTAREVLLAADDVTFARLIYDPVTGSAVLVGDALPPLPEDRAYQLWLINDAGPVSAGVLETTADGRVIHLLSQVVTADRFSAVAISVEPAAGSEAPTTTPIVVGEI